MNEMVDRSVADQREKEIVFSRSVKAGRRIYYLDVKKTLKGEIYLSITESKKVVQGDGDAMRVSFEKHKIFLYQEDFEKFNLALVDILDYVNSEATAKEQE